MASVNPTFRLDVDGKLFKNKNSNYDVQETIIFNSLFTRLSIVKGDLAYFPNLGLKQHLHSIEFNDEYDVQTAIAEFEQDVTSQLNQECRIEYTLDRINKTVNMIFNLENLKYGLEFEYRGTNNSIKVIKPQFLETNS